MPEKLTHFVYSNNVAANGPRNHKVLELLQLGPDHATRMRQLVADRPDREGAEKKAWNRQMRSFLEEISNRVRLRQYVVPSDLAQTHALWAELDPDQIAHIESMAHKPTP